MRPDREMAAWQPREQLTQRRLARTLAEFCAFAAVMGLLMVVLVLA